MSKYCIKCGAEIDDQGRFLSGVRDRSVTED